MLLSGFSQPVIKREPTLVEVTEYEERCHGYKEKGELGQTSRISPM